MDLGANQNVRSGPVLGQDVSPGCLCGKQVQKASFWVRTTRLAQPHSLAGLLTRRTTLFPRVALTPADSNGILPKSRCCGRTTRGALPAESLAALHSPGGHR